MEECKGQPEQIPLQQGCPSLYFNGFSVALGVGDVIISLQQNGAPLMNLNASYTVAKTLAAALNDTIAILETRTGSNIMTTQDIAKNLSIESS